MSFETAKTVTPESFSKGFSFMKKPSVRYPLGGEVKQTLNISEDTKARVAIRRMQNPHAPKISYNAVGAFSSSARTGQFFSATA